MTSIKYSASSTASAATSITVSLGGSPSVGDLVLVWLGVSNEIVTHPPGYNTTNQWFMADSVRQPSSGTTSSWFHTWTVADSGSSVVFTLSPSPSLGVGDKDVSSANVVAVAAVLAGPVGLKEHNAVRSYDRATPLDLSPLKQSATTAFTGLFSDVGDTLVPTGPHALVAVATVDVLYLRVDFATYTNLYGPSVSSTLSLPSAATSLSVVDNPSFLYNPPIIQEGPVSENRLFFRYKLQKYYTVLNNGGVYTANRYLSTDQVNAATAVYTNNAPVTSAVRTDILNAGIGGEFISS